MDLYAGAPYEYASITPASASLVFTAGACPLDAEGQVIAPGDYEAQARATVDNLAAALESAGSSIDQIVKTTVYVVAREHDDLLRVWGVVEASFDAKPPPSTLLGVALLGYTGQLVEIEAVATTR